MGYPQQMWKIAAAVALLGCGDNLRGVPLNELDASRRDADCTRFVRCGLFPDQVTCDAFFRPRDMNNLVAAVEAGAIVYDEIAADRCHDALAAQSCNLTDEDVRLPPADCMRVFRGTLPAGAECAIDETCISGSCGRPDCPRESCCLGECRAVPEPADAGEACEGASGCVEGTFCGRDGMCREVGGAEARCDKDSECAPHLGCTAAGIDPGFCRPLPLLGESCPYLRCAEIQARCDVDTLICVSAAWGAPCSNQNDCGPYGQCDGAGQCILTPTLGMACDGTCRGTSWCNADSGFCEAPKVDGMPCGSDGECASQVCLEGPAFDYCASLPVCF